MCGFKQDFIVFFAIGRSCRKQKIQHNGLRCSMSLVSCFFLIKSTKGLHINGSVRNEDGHNEIDENFPSR